MQRFWGDLYSASSGPRPGRPAGAAALQIYVASFKNNRGEFTSHTHLVSVMLSVGVCSPRPGGLGTWTPGPQPPPLPRRQVYNWKHVKPRSPGGNGRGLRVCTGLTKRGKHTHETGMQRGHGPPLQSCRHLQRTHRWTGTGTGMGGVEAHRSFIYEQSLGGFDAFDESFLPLKHTDPARLSS